MQSNNKCGFFNGALIRPLDSDPFSNVWDRCNTMIMTSMINSIEIKIVQCVMWMDTTHDYQLL